MESPIDSRFGRAAYFIIIDSVSGEYKTIENKQNVQASQGAGIQAAQMISKEGAQILITGFCGPKAFRTLGAANVDIITNASGTVQEVYEDYKAGKLKVAKQPNAEGHWM